MRNETNNTVDKSREKIIKRNSYNTLVVEKLHKKYGLSKTYIRSCINPDSTKATKGIMPDTIRKEYKALVSAVENALSI